MLDRDLNTPVGTHVCSDRSSDIAVRNRGRGIRIPLQQWQNIFKVAGCWCAVNQPPDRIFCSARPCQTSQRRDTTPVPHRLLAAYIHTQSNWKETHSAFCVTCHNTARPLSRGSLSAGHEEADRPAKSDSGQEQDISYGEAKTLGISNGETRTLEISYGEAKTLKIYYGEAKTL